MSKFAAFTGLQKQLGQESAEAVAELVEFYHNSRLDSRKILLQERSQLESNRIRSDSALRIDLIRLEGRLVKQTNDCMSGVIMLFGALSVITLLFG